MSTADHNQEQQLEELFAGLKELLPEQRPRVGQEARGFLRDCQIMKGRIASHEARGIKIRGTKQGIAELETLERLLQKLTSHIMSLSVDSVQAFKKSPSVFGLVEELDEFIPHVQRAIAALKAEAIVPPPKGKRKIYATWVTKEARAEYHKLTGKWRGRSRDPHKDGKPSGRFYEFIKRIFQILDIKASAGSQIDLLVKRKKKEHPR